MKMCHLIEDYPIKLTSIALFWLLRDHICGTEIISRTDKSLKQREIFAKKWNLNDL